MRHLHPLTWLLLGASLAVTVAMAGNAIVTVIVLACAIVISAGRRSPRISAFRSALLVGAMLGLIVLVMGLFTGSGGGNTTVLFTVPQFNLGAGGTFGGIYTLHRLATTGVNAVEILTYGSLVGLMWQACPAGQWCDLAETFLGRAALLLAPLLCIGEALSRVHDTGHPRWGLAAAVVDEDLRIASSWRRYSPHARPSALSALVAGLAVMIVTALVLAASMLGGIPTSLAGGHTVTGLALAGAIACCWALLRPTIGGAALIPSLTWPDALAALAGLLPVAAVLVAGLTGDASQFKTPDGQWPGLPPVTVIAVCLATAVVMILGASVARRGTADGTAAPVDGPAAPTGESSEPAAPAGEAAHA